MENKNVDQAARYSIIQGSRIIASHLPLVDARQKLLMMALCQQTSRGRVQRAHIVAERADRGK